MSAETQYTANTGMVTISTANTNLNGSGTFSDVIITGASNGTLIKSISVKAQGSTTHGMVRIFIWPTGMESYRLLTEIEVPATTQSPTDPAFEITIPFNFELKSGHTLKASTEKGETFNVIIEAQDWSYYASSVRSETTKYTVIDGIADVSDANPNLNGTGTLVTVLTSSGCNIQSITIKAIVSTTDGMIRLFLNDETNTKLFREIPVRAITKSAIAKSFYHRIVFNDGFALKSRWSLKASTEKGESFKVIADALNWSYPA
jgi:hypothetical protein